MQVIVNGLLTHYERAGKGPVMLVLHGWGDSANGWQKMQNAFAETHTVVVPDLPGFGASEPPKYPWGLNDYAEFLETFLQKIDVPKVSVLLGHSNGGAIAIRGLGSGVLSTDKLVLLGSAGIRGEYKGRKAIMRYIAKIGKLLTMPLPHAVKDKLRKTMYASAGSDMLVAEHLQDTFKRIVEDDVRADAARIRVPTLLVYGKDDEATPPRFGRLFAETIPDAKLEIIPHAGHFVHNDQFDETITAIKEFI
jgi:pimeloyl-ACP methyl ester carboxylesterase